MRISLFAGAAVLAAAALLLAAPSAASSLLARAHSPLAQMHSAAATRHAALVESAPTTVPTTRARFQSDFSLAVAVTGGTSGGPSGGASMTTSGSLKYDALLRRMVIHTAQGSIGGLAPFTIDSYNLLDYANNINRTWGGGAVCACDNIQDDFPYYYITPTATFVGTEQITVGNNDVTAQHWNDSFAAGFGDSGTGAPSSASASMAIDFWIDATTTPASMLRIVTNIGVSGSAGAGAGGSAGLQSTFDFSAVTAMPLNDSSVNAIFAPDASCPSCIAAQPSVTTDYTAPSTCPDGCMCSATYTPSLSFCANTVNYPVSSAIFADATDSFVSQVYDTTGLVWNLAGVTPSASCTAAYKEFLCHFYFLQCKAGGALAYPQWVDWSAKCGDAAEVIGSSKESKSYKPDGKAPTPGGGGSGGANAASANGVQMTLVALASAAGAAGALLL